MLEPDPETRELTLTALHDGVAIDDVRAATGWALRVAPGVEVTPAPSVAELAGLRELASV